MLRPATYYLLILLLITSALHVTAQEDIYENLLKEEVEVENPVFMPVVGLGMGSFRFYGDIKSNSSSMLMGTPAYKINMTTFIDKKHYFRGNANVTMGSLISQQYNLTDLQRNINFKSDLTIIGINLQYNFEHIVKVEKPIHPFLSAGFEMIQYTSKTDLIGSNNNKYIYYPDGTVRDKYGKLLSRDYTYETDMRKAMDFGLGSYAQNTLAMPVALGFEFKLTQRAYMQMGTALHFTFTDLLDHISFKNTKGIIGKKGNDMFQFNFITFHYDLFSDAKTVTIKKLFADIDFDYTMYGDEDNDMIFDRNDKCPGTPEGVEVDTAGCPLDTDLDGVPDYLDIEPNTRPNALVNERGAEIKLQDLVNLMNNEAVSREDVKAILRSNLNNKYYAKLSNIVVPPKFKKVDTDKDGYLSFDEVLDEINKFFDDESDFSPQDIYELKDFFFSQ